MGERWQKFAAEVGRFLAVGLLATIVALILFNFLVHGFNTANFAPLNKQPELAYALANGVGMLISYRGTQDWAFRDRQARHADGGVMAFVVINLLTMTIPIACLWISRNGFGLDDPLSDNVSANVVGLLLANAARFFLFRTYVFQRSRCLLISTSPTTEVEEELTGRPDAHRSVHESTEFRQQLPDQRQAQPDHVVVVALDPGDERAAQAVDGERPRDVQRLAGGDVRRDLVVGDVGEVDSGRAVAAATWPVAVSRRQ